MMAVKPRTLKCATLSMSCVLVIVADIERLAPRCAVLRCLCTKKSPSLLGTTGRRLYVVDTKSS